MKILENQPLANLFLAFYIDDWDSEPKEQRDVIKQLISGTILIEKPYPHKIHKELITADSQTTFYREIRFLNIYPSNLIRLFEIFKKILFYK